MYGQPLHRLDSSETLYVYLTTLSVTEIVTLNDWMAVGSEVESTWKEVIVVGRQVLS
jgi:hypothetical protein